MKQPSVVSTIGCPLTKPFVSISHRPDGLFQLEIVRYENSFERHNVIVLKREIMPMIAKCIIDAMEMIDRIE